MEQIQSGPSMQEWSLARHREGRRIAFVPTMGCLHEGHLSLVRLAREQADVVVVSIFVNPLQFLPGEDFSRYPRPFERDVALCREAGVDLLFHPDEHSFYAADHSTHVDETRMSLGLCGGSRPGHFRGVATVVAKLFNLVLPHVAVFGQKDAQQVRVIQRMVRDLAFPVKIVVGPIIREADGLALSSRNRYLSARQRQEALCLSRALEEARRKIRMGERSTALLCEAMRGVIAAAEAASIDYIACVDSETLEPVALVERPVLVLLAVRIGVTRLIDNAVIDPVRT